VATTAARRTVSGNIGEEALTVPIAESPMPDHTLRISIMLTCSKKHPEVMRWLSGVGKLISVATVINCTNMRAEKTAASAAETSRVEPSLAPEGNRAKPAKIKRTEKA
jgi:hypothetical protein